MRNTFGYLLHAFIGLLLPPRRTEVLVAELTDEMLKNLGMGRALPYHHRAAKALVWELKYRKNCRAAELGAAYIKETFEAAAAEEIGRPLLIPIPMHMTKRKVRGYNQTEFLCEALIRSFSGRPLFFEYVPHALTRIREVLPQQKLAKHKRLRNSRGSMSASRGVVEGRHCIVIDDVSTTGATFAEATRALKQAGARAVTCISLAQS